MCFLCLKVYSFCTVSAQFVSPHWLRLGFCCWDSSADAPQKPPKPQDFAMGSMGTGPRARKGDASPVWLVWSRSRADLHSGLPGHEGQGCLAIQNSTCFLSWTPWVDSVLPCWEILGDQIGTFFASSHSPPPLGHLVVSQTRGLQAEKASLMSLKCFPGPLHAVQPIAQQLSSANPVSWGIGWQSTSESASTRCGSTASTRAAPAAQKSQRTAVCAGISASEKQRTAREAQKAQKAPKAHVQKQPTKTSLQCWTSEILWLAHRCDRHLFKGFATLSREIGIGKQGSHAALAQKIEVLWKRHENLLKKDWTLTKDAGCKRKHIGKYHRHWRSAASAMNGQVSPGQQTEMPHAGHGTVRDS